MQNIHFLEQVRGSDLPPIYQGSMGFIYPSSYEGFGIPVLEALNSGVPVITSSGGCLEETAGKGGILINPNDPDEMIHAMSLILEDSAMRDCLIREGAAHALRFREKRPFLLFTMYILNVCTMIKEVRKTKKYIDSGGVILYPTDTIWGIGCDATNADAVQRVYGIKKRSDSKSMLVLVNSFEMLKEYLIELPPNVREVLESAKTPLTVIYPGARGLASNLPAEDGSIGIRITYDPFCQKLIELSGKPIVSTSANISGNPSPTLYNEIESRILDQVDYIVNWRREETQSSAPSAIIKLDTKGSITVIRS